MRFKFEREGLAAFRCCFCCHVRTGTIFLGIFYLLMQIIVLAAFALMMMHPELVKHAEEELRVQDLYPSAASENASRDGLTWMNQKHWNSEDKFLALLITIGSFMVTTMLIYGALRGRPGYLMPFFCLQVFDFCISCLTGVGYFSYIPDIKRWIAIQEWLPEDCRQQLLVLDSDWLMLMAVLFFACVLIVKSYLIGVVWACYKYLLQYERNTNGAVLRNFNASDRTEDTEMLLPPKYEDVILMPAPTTDQPPPPPYSPEN